MHTQLNPCFRLFNGILYIIHWIQTKGDFTSATMDKRVINVLCHYVKEVSRLQIFTSLSKSLRITKIKFKIENWWCYFYSLHSTS